MITTQSEKDLFFDAAVEIGLTDVLMYFISPKYTSIKSSMQSFNAEANSLGIRVHGLEGWRGYFSDSTGPTGLYAAVQAMIDYNSSVAMNERYSGFHIDMEPQDGQGDEVILFHNGIADSALTTQQRADREYIMNDWVGIHGTISGMMVAESLKFGSSIPSWTDDYFGEPVHLDYSTGALVLHALVPLIDECIFMTYNTDPANAAGRFSGEASYVDSLSPINRAIVLGAMETHVGPGATVSYGDHATKNDRASVLSDRQTIINGSLVYRSFGGVAIHDWVGWRDLPAT